MSGTERLTLHKFELLVRDVVDIINMDKGESRVYDLEFISYFLGMMFLKRLSDSFDEEEEKVIQHYLSKGKTKAQAEDLATDEDEYDKTFFVPEKGRWRNFKDLKHDIGAELNKATEVIEEYNSSLEGVLVSIDFNRKDKLPDKKIRDLILVLSTYRFRDEDFERPDILSFSHEYIFKTYVEKIGNSGGEFYTPREVSELMVSLLKPRSGMRVYDPTAGSGSLLVTARRYLLNQGEEPSELSFFGQEIDLTMWVISRINLLLSNVFSADIRRGDTLRNPQHIENGRLMTFDRVIANPPFGLTNWGVEDLRSDEFGRFPYGTPSRRNADWAFVQHMIASVNSEGMVGVVVTHDALYRHSSEEYIRERIIEDDLLEAVIGLPTPILYGTGMPVVLLIINKTKSTERKGKVIFIDASRNFEKHSKNLVRMREEDIRLVCSAFEDFRTVGDFCKVIGVNDILEKNSIFSIKTYLDNSPEGHQLRALKAQQNEFEIYSFSDNEFCLEIRKGRYIRECINENMILIPEHFEGKVMNPSNVNLVDDQRKMYRFYGVTLNPEIILSDYACNVFKSDFGRLMLKSKSRGTRGTITRDAIREFEIPVPPIATQKIIVSAAKKLEKLEGYIGGCSNEISLNPKNAILLQDKLDGMLESISELSASDKLLSLIRKGETSTLEFKESLSLDIKKTEFGKDYSPKKEKYIEKNVLKTIVAFINSKGGTLLVGVRDDGFVKGINDELKCFHKGNEDNFLLYFKNLLKDKIGAKFYDFFDTNIVNVQGEKVLVVECNHSPADPCFLDGEEFFVRTTPATDQLIGAKMVEYINIHFEK